VITGNFANFNNGASWNSLTGNVTTVGTNGAASYYNAFDMSGNVFEWTDLDGTVDETRVLRGGGWNLNETFLASFYIGFNPAEFDGFNVGFRLAAVPEPSTYVMALAGLACGGSVVRRRRKRA
jgi:formylglycine-generating enzyme required for sulfatase activity